MTKGKQEYLNRALAGEFDNDPINVTFREYLKLERMVLEIDIINTLLAGLNRGAKMPLDNLGIKIDSESLTILTDILRNNNAKLIAIPAQYPATD